MIFFYATSYVLLVQSAKNVNEADYKSLTIVLRPLISVLQINLPTGTVI